MKTKEVTGDEAHETLDALEGHQLLKHEGKFACGSCEITNPHGDGKRQRQVRLRQLEHPPPTGDEKGKGKGYHTMPKCIELILSTQGTI